MQDIIIFNYSFNFMHILCDSR